MRVQIWYILSVLLLVETRDVLCIADEYDGTRTAASL